MAAGRPFVATAKEGSTLWKLAEESGAFRCTSPGDADAFTKEVLKLINDSRLQVRLGEQGRAYVLEHTTCEYVLGALAKICSASRKNISVEII